MDSGVGMRCWLATRKVETKSAIDASVNLVRDSCDSVQVGLSARRRRRADGPHPR